MNNNVYQQIWNSDRHRFLVSPRHNNGNWLDPEADILLDEQIKAFGRQDLDLAQKPLFYRVNEAKLEKIPTFVSLIHLLDNYKFAHQQTEIVTRAEKTEIEQFINDICQTKPIKIARQYIINQLKFKFSPESFRHHLTSIWFDLYTNYFGGTPTKDASGFEHIFVGEGKYDFSLETKSKISGAISGYHSWVKFYLDEKQQKVNYLGHNYELQGDLGHENPYIVSLQMLWRDFDTQDDLTVELFKKKGCFFVGTSPECEIAMGTVAYYENLANYKFKAEKRRTTINGVNYDLALYRNIEPDGKRGNYIRSFYPIFLGTEN